MKLKLLFVILLAALLSACSSDDPATPTPTKTPVPVEAAAPAPATSTPEPTPPPANTPTPAPVADEPAPDEWFGLVDDLDRTQDLGGVLVTVKGAGLLNWDEAVARSPDLQTLTQFDAFKDSTVFGVVTVVVTNTTDSKINVYPSQGTVVVGSEQVDLIQYGFFNDQIGGTLFPGVEQEAELGFTLKRTAWEAIAAGTSLIYEISTPVLDQNFDRLADTPYTFELQLAPSALNNP